jgi:hypothetical protein
MKIVVFDLDETLGYFTQYSIFWSCLDKYLLENNNYNLTLKDFSSILDLYPEFLRPGIMNILNYLKNKKISNCCHKMMIYTNNNGSKSWANFILKYFEEKIKYKLFDQIIAAFKINGKQIEMCRTTHDKTHKDLIRCTKIPLNAEICYLDDVFYPEMSHKNVYYINIKPYTHDLDFDVLVERFLKCDFCKNLIKNIDNFKTQMMKDFKLFNFEILEKNNEEYEVDKILSKQILSHLHDFFNKTTKTTGKTSGKTKKSYGNKKSKTFKNKY